jgi:outer membrane protein OmpA-like peptidoglycan-associated protein/Tol biopolymer transport system component
MKTVRLIVLILLQVVIITSGTAQKKKFKELHDEAFKHLAEDNYKLALPILLEMERMDDKNNNTLFKIGFCYVQSNYDKALAIPYFEKILSRKSPVTNSYKAGNYKEKKAPIEVLRYLGEAYHYDYQFDKALEYYLMYKDILSENNAKFNKDVDRLIATTKNAQQLVAQPVEIIVKGMDAINTIYPEYRPKLTGNEMTMYFTSRRPLEGSTLSENTFMEDIYLTENKKGIWQEALRLENGINTPGHDACLYVSPDGLYMILYRATVSSVGFGSIYETNFINGQWSEPKLMVGDLNSSHWQTDVCLSPEGNTMYFTSDRPGGRGGRDLWVINKLPNGDWGKAQNMGANFNTEYDEEAPYIHPDGKTFYFSSKGHNTMGGYDIFRSDLGNDGKWGKPYNIGYPANTTGDDVFFFPTLDGKRVYFSSYRKEGKGDQDIYIVEFPGNEEKTLAVYQGVAKDKAGNVLEDLIITVYDESGEVVGEYRPNTSTGRYLFILQPGHTYDIEYNDKGVIGVDRVTVGSTGGVAEYVKVATKEKEKIKITSGEIVDDEILALIDTEGPQNFEIVEIELNLPENYISSHVENKDNTKDPAKDTKKEINNPIEYASQGEMMKDLYFVYDRTKIIEKSIPDYQATLKYLKDNPSVKIVIEGHTDSHGSDEYNLWLASARSNKIRNMLNQDGIGWSRMTTKTYGESKPIAPNKNPDGTDNPEGRQLNRRVHFVEKGAPQMAEVITTSLDTTTQTLTISVQNSEVMNDEGNIDYTIIEYGADDVLCKVQLGAFRKKLPESKFDNALEVGFYRGDDGLYKYFSGTFMSKTIAEEHCKRMAAEGYADAFIVYFKEGKRLSVEEVAALFQGNEKEQDVTVNP